VTHYDLITNRGLYDEYQKYAAANPGKAMLMPTYFGRLPLRLLPVKLYTQATISVPAGQTLSVVANPWYSTNSTNLPIAAGYVVGTTGSNQGSTVASLIAYPTQPAQVVPSDTTSYMIGAGEIQTETYRSSTLDEWPLISSTAASNVHGYLQYHIDQTTPGANEYVFTGNFAHIQSVLGAIDATSLGNELPAAPKENAKHAVLICPPTVSGTGCWQMGSTTGVGSSTWATLVNYELTNPTMTITNVAANAITVVVRCTRWFYVAPSEAFLANTNIPTLPESPFQLPRAVLTYGSTFGSANSMDLASIKAVNATLNHRDAIEAHPGTNHLLLNDRAEAKVLAPSSAVPSIPDSAHRLAVSGSAHEHETIGDAIGGAASAYGGYKAIDRLANSQLGKRMAQAVSKTATNAAERVSGSVARAAEGFFSRAIGWIVREAPAIGERLLIAA
jgi:hypothetical protein